MGEGPSEEVTPKGWAGFICDTRQWRLSLRSSGCTTSKAMCVQGLGRWPLCATGQHGDSMGWYVSPVLAAPGVRVQGELLGARTVLLSLSCF